MKLKKMNRALAGALLVSGALGVNSGAYALNINPSSASLVYTSGIATPSALSVDDVELALASVFITPGELGEAYKQNVGGAELGTAAAYYSTVFTPPVGPSDAQITWSGAFYIDCGDCYLVVKDGNHVPYVYIFDISNWDGQETLDLSGFWTDQGAISYVGIYNNYSMEGGGGTIAAIPEADTYAMLLAGLGLVGFAARRKLSQTA